MPRDLTPTRGNSSDNTFIEMLLGAFISNAFSKSFVQGSLINCLNYSTLASMGKTILLVEHNYYFHYTFEY